MTDHATITSMIETVGKISAMAYDMGFEAARIGQSRESNPFQHVKTRYYPESLLTAWYSGYTDYEDEINV